MRFLTKVLGSFDDFDYWGAWEAGHVFTNGTEGAKKLKELMALVKDQNDMDKALEKSLGIPTVEHDKKSYNASIKKNVKKNEAYFSSTSPEDGEFEFFPFDLDQALESLQAAQSGGRRFQARKPKAPAKKSRRY